jgi:hypothetical protein
MPMISQQSIETLPAVKPLLRVFHSFNTRPWRRQRMDGSEEWNMGMSDSFRQEDLALYPVHRFEALIDSTYP